MAMTQEPSVYQRRRKASAQELAQIPWLTLLTAQEREFVAPQIVVSDPKTGDYVCRMGRPVTFWFGVIEGLLKMSTDSASGRTITFTGVPPGGWFGEGTALKREPYRYNIMALRHSVVAGIPVDTFHWLLDNSIGFNRFVMNQFNERVAQFIQAREIDRSNDPDMRVARNLAALFIFVNPHSLQIQHTQSVPSPRFAIACRFLKQGISAGIVFVAHCGKCSGVIGKRRLTPYTHTK